MRGFYENKSQEGTSVNDQKVNNNDDKSSTLSDGDEDPEAAEFNKNKDSMENKRKKQQAQKSGDIMKKNHYELLAMEDVYATEDQIKKSFRKLSLIYHPDKYEDGTYDDMAKTKWLNLQEAYECLMDKEKRRIYDSTMEFDDWIPAKTLGENEDFYEVYRMVLKRNAYWHSDPSKLHDFGDAKTSWERVNKFYKNWEKFVSWRDFTMEDEYDVMQAESRYEKRWMEKQNRCMKGDLYKKERTRIFNLVENCRASDPRVLAKDQEEKEKFDKIKRDKVEKKQQKIDGVQKIIREKKEAEEKLITDKKDEEDRKRQEIK